MKFEAVKKKVIIEGGVVAVILAVLGAAVYYLGMVEEETQQRKQLLESQLSAVTMEKQTLQDKYQKIQSNFDFYTQVSQKNAKNGLSISRQLLRQKVNEFKTRYFLNDLTLNMSPVQELTDQKYRYGSAVMVASTLDANFDALTDEDIFSLVQALQDELSGSLKINKFTIERMSKVTDESLRSIAKNGQYSMVKGHMQFTWYGIKPVEPNATGR